MDPTPPANLPKNKNNAPAPSDRERLKEVATTDLTDSKVNEDFVDWLKNKGPTWLLVVLVVLVAIMGWERYQNWKTTKVANAFFDYEEANDPETLKLVAEDHDGVASVGSLARLRAADVYLAEALARRDATNSEEMLDDAAIETRLNDARQLYQQVYEETADNDGQHLMRLPAIFGLAAVAESKGELQAAGDYYDEAIVLAGETYPHIARFATGRKESLTTLEDVPTILKRTEVPVESPIDPLLRDLLGDDNDSAGDSDTSSRSE